jgi:hypothetical protein
MPPSMPPLRGHAGPRKSREGGGVGERGRGRARSGAHYNPEGIQKRRAARGQRP